VKFEHGFLKPEAFSFIDSDGLVGTQQAKDIEKPFETDDVFHFHTWLLFQLLYAKLN
jgi:hypothetical protein